MPGRRRALERFASSASRPTLISHNHMAVTTLTEPPGNSRIPVPTPDQNRPGEPGARRPPGGDSAGGIGDPVEPLREQGPFAGREVGLRLG